MSKKKKTFILIKIITFCLFIISGWTISSSSATEFWIKFIIFTILFIILTILNEIEPKAKEKEND